MKKQAYECKRAVSFASRWKKQPVIYRNMENLRALMEAVCRIAREAGHFLKEERKSFRREVVQEKHAHDYVSYVDKASEKRIVSALKELLPEAGFRLCIRMNPIAGLWTRWTGLRIISMTMRLTVYV